jgi:hypothetical protein
MHYRGGSLLKICIALFFAVILTGYSAGAQERTYIGEDVKVQNYPDAPVELQISKVVTKPTDSEEWFDTCFYYSVRNKTDRVLASYSYEIVDNREKASVMGKSGDLKPFEFIRDREQCVPNSALKSEGYFIFRLTFVELRDRTLWESEDHRRAVEFLFKGVNFKKKKTWQLVPNF